MKPAFLTKCVYFFCAAAAAVIILACVLKLETIYFFAFFAFLTVPVFISGKNLLSPKVFAVCLFAVSFAVKLAFVLIVKTQPISDFNTFLAAARNVAGGNYEIINNSQYFQDWAYQTGYVIWMSFFVKFFGAGVTFFKVMNCVCLAAADTLVYLFARRAATEKAARTAAFVYMLYPGVYFLAPVLTNQHLCNMLIFGGLFLYMRAGGKGRPDSAPAILTAAGAGALIALGDAVRPVGIIVIAAAAFAGIVKAAERKREAVKSLIPLAALAVSFFAAAFLLSSAVKFSGINENGLTNNFTAWKFVVGLNHQTGGQYSYDDDINICRITDRAERQATAEAVIRERLSVPPSQMLMLLAGKIYNMWAAYDATHWAFSHVTPGSSVKIPPFGAVETEKLLGYARKAGGAFYCGAFVLLLCFAVRAAKNGGAGNAAFLLCVIFAMYFGAHLFIEVQVRYRDFAMVPVFALSAGGIDACARAFARRRPLMK